MSGANRTDFPRGANEKTKFLVILFGTVEYDGRVQRMIELLKELGMVTLVDLAKQEALSDATFDGLERFSIAMPPKSRQFAKHFGLARAALRVALKLRPDVVVAEDYFTTWSGWFISKLVGATLIYDAHELLVPEPVERMSLRSLVWYMLERFVVKRAALVVAANEQRAQIMAKHYDLPKHLEYMRNIPQPPSASLSIDNILCQFPALIRKKPQDRIILYQGYVSLERGLDRFAQALTHLPQEYRLVIVGDGPDLQHLQEICKAMGHYDRLDCLGRVPNCALPAIAACADVGVVTYSYEGLNNIYCAPNKIFEYAQAGLPVVATDQLPLKILVEGYRIGALIRREDSPQAVAGVLRQVADSKECFLQQLERFLDNNRWEDEAARVRGRIKKVLSEAGHEC